VAANPVRIEIRGLTNEREQAQRDLRETLGALEERLIPQLAARRLVQRHDPAVVVTGMVAVGVAVGLARDPRPGARLASVFAAGVAGAIIYRLTR